MWGRGIGENFFFLPSYFFFCPCDFWLNFFPPLFPKHFIFHCEPQTFPLRSEFSLETSVVCCLVAKSCLTLLQPSPARLFCPWDFPGKNAGVGCHFLLQGIFLTQVLSLHLLHCRWIFFFFLPLRHQGSPSLSLNDRRWIGYTEALEKRDTSFPSPALFYLLA